MKSTFRSARLRSASRSSSVPRGRGSPPRTPKLYRPPTSSATASATERPPSTRRRRLIPLRTWEARRRSEAPPPQQVQAREARQGGAEHQQRTGLGHEVHVHLPEPGGREVARGRVGRNP